MTPTPEQRFSDRVENYLRQRTGAGGMKPSRLGFLGVLAVQAPRATELSLQSRARV
jgi:hypothetical protein